MQKKNYTSTFSNRNFYPGNFKFLINFQKTIHHKLISELSYTSLWNLSSDLHRFFSKINFQKIPKFDEKKSLNLGGRICTLLSAREVQKWKFHFNMQLNFINQQMGLVVLEASSPAVGPGSHSKNIDGPGQSVESFSYSYWLHFRVS